MDSMRRPLLYILGTAVTVSVISIVLGLNQGHHQFLLKSPSMTVRDPSKPVDVLIIGGGPAGLSAATTLYRHQHDIRVFDHNKPRNTWDTETHALPTWEGKRPSKFREESRKELQETGLVEFISAEIKSIDKGEDQLFRLTTTDGTQWKGRKVLLSMGVQLQMLDIPGYTDCFPERILHCLFTFGYEHRGSSSAGILAVGFAGSPFHANILVDDAKKFADKVTIYTNGNEALAAEIKKAATYNDTAYDTRKIVSFTKNASSIFIKFEDGEIKEEKFVVHQPRTQVNPAFVDQLGLELNERGDVMTNMPFYQTSVPGVFAAGDCASPFKIISNAVLMGANAGAGIARELPTHITGHTSKRLL